ncbi:GlcG/HbpS family heme-binding protein [Allostreptomyces psammosilenae]|uniref:Uncharacterized protein GlcG (DUF336 family) n=1 Tax=Allostreptomyces psammosilenae TaxID=1892865 RepID=A0A852ZVM8_9ACTN|nr:heme-binding protein [Allostreptomyces psammosilenae]NYI05300.1 uncharacterized protein GlcG (DUF336 family) [Allostreptomyces psammosilenae]
MTTFPLDEAVRRTEAGLVRAREMGVPMNIAVVDSAGHLVHFARMDGALLGSVDIAVRKARTAALFRLPSATIGELSRSGGPAYDLHHSNGGLVPFGGGLPVLGADGDVVGAVGVSGGTVEQDVLVAEACLSATPTATVPEATASGA